MNKAEDPAAVFFRRERRVRGSGYGVHAGRHHLRGGELMGNFPDWVYEVVGQLAEQKEIHPKFLFESGAFEGTRQWEWCPCVALTQVPKEVVEEAIKNREERRKAEKEAFKQNLLEATIAITDRLYSLGLPEPVVDKILRETKIEANKLREAKHGE